MQMRDPKPLICETFFKASALARGCLDEGLRRKAPGPVREGEGTPAPAGPAVSAGGVAPACACHGVLDPAAFANGKRTPAVVLYSRQGQVRAVIDESEEPSGARRPRRAIGDRPRGEGAADGVWLTTAPAPRQRRGS